MLIACMPMRDGNDIQLPGRDGSSKTPLPERSANSDTWAIGLRFSRITAMCGDLTSASGSPRAVTANSVDAAAIDGNAHAHNHRPQFAAVFLRLPANSPCVMPHPRVFDFSPQQPQFTGFCFTLPHHSLACLRVLFIGPAKTRSRQLDCDIDLGSLFSASESLGHRCA